MLEPAVIERFVEALVRVFVADVLADDMDRDVVDRVLDPVHQVLPRLHVALGLGQVQVFEHDAIETLGREDQRHFVDGRHVLGGNDGLFGDVAEQRDLALDVGIEEAVGAAEQNVGLNADRAQVAHAVLRRLGLELAGSADERHQREVNVEGVIAPDVLSELADRFEERQTLDVADGAADLDEDDIHVVRNRSDGVLDFVGDMRNHLDGAAEVIAAALFLDHALIDLAGRPVRVLGRGDAGEALVMTEIEVGLGAIVGDVDLAVLVWAHRARIDVDVRVELLQGHAIAVSFEQRADRCGRESFAER